MASHKGKFLLASPRLRDPNFARAVVLLVQHDDDGALGLVLNKPTTVTVKEAVSQLDEPPDGAPESPLLLGGPCQGPLVALHTDEDAGEIRVLDGLWFSAEKLRVEQVMDRSGGERALYFAGYSGWGAKQLEGELDEGAWLVVPAEPKWIFDPPANLWGKLITATTAGEGLGVEQIPDDPSLN